MCKMLLSDIGRATVGWNLVDSTRHACDEVVLVRNKGGQTATVAHFHTKTKHDFICVHVGPTIAGSAYTSSLV